MSEPTSTVEPQPRPAVRRRGGRALTRALLLGLGVALVALSVPGSPIPAQGQAVGSAGGTDLDGPWEVTATPVTGLSDGQRVSITVKAAPTTTIYSAEATLCRSGVTYQASVDDIRPADSQPGGPNCPPVPISTSADSIAVDTFTFQNATKPEGETFTFRVGTGVANWKSFDQVDRSLTCGPDAPCTLVVKVFVEADGPGSAHWEPWTQAIGYRIEDPIAGCGGTAAGFLASGGSNRIASAWVDWTLAQCRSGAQSGAASTGSFVAEGPAVGLFADGKLDLAYSAVGYDDQVGLAPPEEHPDGRRPGVAVPVALNATVLAVSNGAIGNNGKNVPYSNVRLTLEEVSALLSGGVYDMPSHLAAIYARNPQLAATGFFNTQTGFQVAATAEAEATSWFATRHLDTLRPDAWRVPANAGVFGSDAGLPRGADAALAIAAPSYAGALNLFSSRPVLERNLNVNGFGGIWVLTDLATARGLGLTPVSIENASGAFVAPTAETMAAAVTTMKPAADGQLVPRPTATGASPAATDGMLVPSPGAVGGAGEVQPYPLTFVEYALAPATPLVDATCTPRAGSQALLTTWLSYITGPGQKILPKGFEPLPPALATEAATAVAEVGTAPLPCTPPVTPPGAEPDLDAGDGGGGGVGGFGDGGGFGSSFDTGGAGSSGSSGFGGSSGVGSSGAAGGSETGGAAAAAAKQQEDIALAAATTAPGYGGQRGSSVLVTVVALLGIVLLTSAAALASSGWPRSRRSTGGAR